MADAARPGFTPNLVVGVGITALGILLTMDRLGLVTVTAWLRFWPVLLVLFGTAVVVQSLRPRVPGEGRPAPILSAPLVILLVAAGLLATRTSDTGAASAGDAVTVHAVLSGNERAVAGRPFRTAETTAVMGEARLDLRHAVLPPGEQATIDVVTVMGHTIVYVPRDWDVNFEAVPVMGSVDDERPGRRQAGSGGGTDPQGGASASIDVPDPAAPPSAADAGADAGAGASAAPPRLVVRGFVLMGGIVIKS